MSKPKKVKLLAIDEKQNIIWIVIKEGITKFVEIGKEQINKLGIYNNPFILILLLLHC